MRENLISGGGRCMMMKEISISIMKDEEWMTRLREIFGEGKTPIVLVVRSFF